MTSLDWLICYDVLCQRRRNRLYRRLLRQAIPVQYSVFLASLTRRELQELADELTDIVEPEEDDLRVYRLAREGHRLDNARLLSRDSVLILDSEGKAL